MNKYISFVFISLVSSILSAQQLKVLQNDIYFKHNDKMYFINMLNDSVDFFYGYDVIDSTSVFVAYQKRGYAEAFAVMAIVNVKTGKRMFIGELGGTGESVF